MTDDLILLEVERLLLKRADMSGMLTSTDGGETWTTATKRSLIDVKRVIPALRAEGYEIVKREQ